MASFREMFFTPAEFASIARIDRSEISALETQGILKTTKRKMGNVDRKMIALEDMQNFFRVVRESVQPDMSNGTGAVAAATTSESPFGDFNPKHKIQMFYNVKGGTGKSTLSAQYVMRAAMMGLKLLRWISTVKAISR